MANKRNNARSERPEGTTLGDKAGSIGYPLRDIADEWVTVEGLEFLTREVTDRDTGEKVTRDLCIITFDGNNKVHTWSPFLIEKLRSVDSADLPLPARFTQVDTSNGQRVWTVE